MSDDVLTYYSDGFELSFDVDVVETCLDRLKDDHDNIQHGFAIEDGVIVFGDSFEDGDCYIAHVADIDGYQSPKVLDEKPHWYTSLQSLERAIEELRGESFEDYVRDIDVLPSINEYETTDSGNVKVTSWCFDGSELTALHEDDGTNVLSVGEDGGDVTILVQDVRDE